MQAICKELPQFKEKSKNLTFHLTMGEFENEEKCLEAMKLLEKWETIEFDSNEISVMHLNNSRKFYDIRSTISFGKNVMIQKEEK